MAQPIEICLEDVAAGASLDEERYLRCVALEGRQPGLGIDARGDVQWQSTKPLAAELWVSLDERLILYRHSDAPPVRLTRASRQLDVPCGKPVVMLAGDLIALGTRLLRVHVHGVATSVHPPSRLSARIIAQAARAAAVLAMGAAVAGCERTSTPHPTVGLPPGIPPATATTPGSGPLRPGEPPPPPSGTAPIEVREMPPAPPIGP
jgi:hypothetical protein